jgi:hypothetical protein
MLRASRLFSVLFQPRLVASSLSHNEGIHDRKLDVAPRLDRLEDFQGHQFAFELHNFLTVTYLP